MPAMKVLSAVVLALTIGCGGGSSKAPVGPKEPEPTPDPIPKTAGPECKVVAEQLVQMLLADKPDRHAKAIGIVTKRCSDDKWSDEARSCAASAQNADEADGCVKHLTPTQKEAMQNAAKEFEDDGPADGASGAKPASAPAPAPGGRTRGAVKKDTKDKGKSKGADPCQGGESDPCQGGQ
jgi:hypothetical protein